MYSAEVCFWNNQPEPPQFQENSQGDILSESLTLAKVFVRNNNLVSTLSSIVSDDYNFVARPQKYFLVDEDRTQFLGLWDLRIPSSATTFCVFFFDVFLLLSKRTLLSL